MSSAHRKASLSLHFTIVGGGIAGLACAYVLQKAGHQTLVLERSDGKSMTPGGVRSPPNMTRILNEWGLKSKLSQIAVIGCGNAFRAGATGEKIGALVLHDQIMRDLRADYLYLRYGDVFEILCDLAAKTGVKVRHNTIVAEVDPEHPSVTLSTGENIKCDVIIGADGYDSIVHRTGLRYDAEERPDHRWSANLAVPAEKIKNDPELAPLLDTSELSLWMGHNASIYGHPTRKGNEYAVILSWSSNPSGSMDEDFFTQHPVGKLGFPFGLFEPRLHRLVLLGEKASSVKYILRDPLESLIHENGTVILAGHAAHPMPPNLNQNTALAIEDAAVLGNLFSRVSSRSQIPTLAGAFEDLRQPRSVEVINSEREKLNFVTLPGGEEQHMRDQGLKAMLQQASADWDQADEEYLRIQWEEFIQMCNYDAYEAVDDWWTMWGSAMEQDDEDEEPYVPTTMEIPASSLKEHVRARTPSDDTPRALNGRGT